jgi:hypothetical protein
MMISMAIGLVCVLLGLLLVLLWQVPIDKWFAGPTQGRFK